MVGIATILLAGDACDGPYAVGTLHSPFTEADLVSDNRLLGSWVPGDDDDEADDADVVVVLERGRGRYVEYFWDRSFRPRDTVPGDTAAPITGSIVWRQTSVEFDLYQLGQHLVMDFGSAFGLDSANDRFGDLTGMRIVVPVLLVVSGDTMWSAAVPPGALMDLAEEGGDSVTWIDRGGVRLIRGSSAHVRDILLRLFADTTLLDRGKSSVRARFGTGPVGMTAAATED